MKRKRLLLLWMAVDPEGRNAGAGGDMGSHIRTPPFGWIHSNESIRMAAPTMACCSQPGVRTAGPWRRSDCDKPVAQKQGRLCRWQSLVTLFHTRTRGSLSIRNCGQGPTGVHGADVLGGELGKWVEAGGGAQVGDGLRHLVHIPHCVVQSPQPVALLPGACCSRRHRLVPRQVRALPATSTWRSSRAAIYHQHAVPGRFIAK